MRLAAFLVIAIVVQIGFAWHRWGVEAALCALTVGAWGWSAAFSYVKWQEGRARQLEVLTRLEKYRRGLGDE